MNNEIVEVINNKDLMNVAWKAANQFKSSLNEDDRYTCILNSIWRALKSYDELSETSFSTFLHKGVIMECLSYRKANILNKMYPNGAKIRLGSLYKTQDSVDMIEEISTCKDPQLIYDRYYKNMTLSEIASERGVSKESIRNKIKKNLFSLKKRFTSGV